MNHNPAPNPPVFTQKVPNPFPLKHRGKIVWRAVKTITFVQPDGTKAKQVINATRATPAEAQFALMQRLATLKPAPPPLLRQQPNPLGKPANIGANGESSGIGETAKTIDEYLKEYLTEISTGDGAVREATAIGYGYAIKAILRERYGLAGIAVSEITPELIKQWRQNLTDKPAPRTGKPIGAKWQKELTILLSGALAAAVTEGYLDTNPLELIKSAPEQKRRARVAAKQEHQRKAIREQAENIKARIYWQPQTQLAKLLADYSSDPTDWNHTRLTYVALSYLGLRPQETAISLDKIDFRAGKETITIAQTRSGTKIIEATKTPAGTRTLPLVEPWLSIVKEQARRRKLATGNDNPMLLAAKGGGFFRQQNHNEDYRLLLEECSMDYIRLYANRHITTTILQKLNYPREIIESICGWERPSDSLLTTYGHFTDDDRIKQAVVDLGEFIMGEPMREVD
jgi:hypothetical protein